MICIIVTTMTELPKHIAEAKNKYLAKVRLQEMEEENYVNTDCKTIVDAYEKMVMKQMPENISKLLNSDKKWTYNNDDGTLIHGDSIKLSKYFMSPYSSCDNESIQRIDKLQDIVNLAGNVDLNNIYTSRRYMLVTYKLPDTLFSYFKIGGYTHYVAIK